MHADRHIDHPAMPSELPCAHPGNSCHPVFYTELVRFVSMSAVDFADVTASSMSTNVQLAHFCSFLLRQDHSHDTGMGRALLFADRLSVDVHRGSHIGVPQQFLLNLHIHAKQSEHGAVGVPKRMPSHAAPKPTG